MPSEARRQEAECKVDLEALVWEAIVVATAEVTACLWVADSDVRSNSSYNTPAPCP